MSSIKLAPIIVLRPEMVRLLFFLGASAILLGCAPPTLPDVNDAKDETSVSAAIELEKRPAFLSLRPDSALAILAQELDRVAISRSTFIPRRQSAEASLLASRFSRFPQITPTGNAPLNSDDEASLGLSLEQVLWDGGRIKSQLTKGELDVADAALRAWIERSEMVLDGLLSYVNVSRLQTQIAILAVLQDDLESLDVRLQARADGGVADRGERLRMSVAHQEVQRSIIGKKSELRVLQADLTRALNQNTFSVKLTISNEAVSNCSRAWPLLDAPEDSLALVSSRRAEADVQQARAMRLPRILLDVGMSTLVTPAIGLRLDGDDMLGLEQKSKLESLNAATMEASAAYMKQLSDTLAETSRLDEAAVGFQTDIKSLEELIQTNRSTLKLFYEQLEVGSIPIMEGVTIFRENAETLLSMADIQSKLLENCLRASNLRGVLVPFGDQNE